MNPSSLETLTPFKRVNYFEGQVLTAKDLQDEQTYFRNKRRLLNKALHGHGVVCGLELSLHPEVVQIAPGLALDCQGNEIVVPRKTELPLPESGIRHYLVIKYTESPTDLVPVVMGLEETQATRIAEGFLLSYQSSDPCRHYTLAKGDCGLCEEPHAVPLAELQRRGSGWSIRAYSDTCDRWWQRLMVAMLSWGDSRRRHRQISPCR
jgi:hypothetical protein